MYLRRVRVQHLKLLRDLELNFTGPDGSIRNWTVIIGQNGTGKTSLLQAIALAAAGSLQVNTLAGRVIGHLRDRRSTDALQVDATFEFLHGERDARLHPLLSGKLPSPLALRSQVTLGEGESTIRASSSYGRARRAEPRDPLDDARSRNRQRWFVAGYGVARFLPDVGRVSTLDRPSIERMLPLFDPTMPLTSTGFSSYFGEGKKARLFHRVLKRALLNVESILPDIVDLELRGYGGVQRPGDLLERDRFAQRLDQATRGDPTRVGAGDPGYPAGATRPGLVQATRAGDPGYPAGGRPTRVGGDPTRVGAGARRRRRPDPAWRRWRHRSRSR